MKDKKENENIFDEIGFEEYNLMLQNSSDVPNCDKNFANVLVRILRGDLK